METKNRYSVGSYSQNEIGRVLAHARAKKVGFTTVAGPREDFQFEDGTTISVAEGMTAVVLITSDLDVVGSFWDGFVFPD